MHPRNPALNVAARWQLDGNVSDATVAEAWRYLVARHAALRTHLETRGGEPVQVVEPPGPFALAYHDLRGLPPAAAEAQAERLALLEARTPFDSSVAPLLRVSRITLGAGRSTLLVTAHHAVCDGWSVGILAREFGELCASLERGEPARLPDLPLRFGQAAELERERLRDEPFTAELLALREMFAGFAQFELPTDRPRPAVQTYNGALAERTLDVSLTSQLAALARRNGCTLFMASLAALLTLLHRYTGETDIAIGTQVAGRDDALLEGIVGCFINSVAMRGDLSEDPSFALLLERIRDTASDSFDLRHVPFERLVHMLRPKRDASRSTLFSINFGLRSFVRDVRYDDFSLRESPSPSGGALYDVNFFMAERSGEWRIACEYNTDLFDDDTARGLIERLEVLLRAVVADPERPISQLPLLTEADRYDARVRGNETTAAYPFERLVTELVTARAESTPAALAVVCGEATLTYAELERASNRLARELIRRDYGAGRLVGVLLARSPELVVTLLAVLKAGSAYVPLDPAYPRERLNYIIEDSHVAAIVSDSSLRERVAAASVPFVCHDTDAHAIERQPADTLPSAATPQDVAYVIYTSGSTGWPKGVQIEHRALVNLLCAMAIAPGMDSDDVLVAVTTISFDIAALEIFLPLVQGARLVIAREHEALDAAELLRSMERHHATIVQATPVTWQLLVERGWTNPALKMLCGGEALPRALADRLLERGGELWNMYGPTETTIWSAVRRVERGERSVLVGGPIANTQFYVLDARGALVPPGVPGELYIGGDGVARGYFERPDLTAERFVPDPFRAVPGARLYRTGDIVRRRGAGAFEFLGRADHQIKLRGFRIELSEIEAVLLRQPGVVEAVAVVRGEMGAEQALFAYVTGAPEGAGVEGWETRLRSSLSEWLPQYMVPARIIALPALPRTPNGKIDRQALPLPMAGTPHAEQAPANAMEALLATLIGEMLEHARIGRDDDIFALGFHSLLAVRLVDRIEHAMGVRLPLHAVYDAQTVAHLALRITNASKSAQAFSEPQPIVTLNPAGGRPPFLYLHNDLLTDGMYCRRLAAAVGSEQPIHAIAPHGTAGMPTLYSIEAMARDYARRLRDWQPRGPYRLGGICVGGLVAYETARLLQAQGERVERLVLINSLPLSTPVNRFAGRVMRAVGFNHRLPLRLRESICYNIELLIDELLGRGPVGFFYYMAERSRTLYRRVALRKPPQISATDPLSRRRSSGEAENIIAYRIAPLMHDVRPYDGDFTLVWSSEERLPVDAARATWRALAKSVRVITIPGDHLSPVLGGVEDLGRALESELR